MSATTFKAGKRVESKDAIEDFKFLKRIIKFS